MDGLITFAMFFDVTLVLGKVNPSISWETVSRDLRPDWTMSRPKAVPTGMGLVMYSTAINHHITVIVNRSNDVMMRCGLRA